MSNRETVRVTFYIVTADRWYSEADLAEKLSKINEVIDLDEVLHREVYGTLSIINNGQELLGPPYATNLFSLPNSAFLLESREINRLFFRDVSTLTDYWLSFSTVKDKNVLTYNLVNSRSDLVHRANLPLKSFVKAYLLCQMRTSRLYGFIGDTDIETDIRNWWEIDWPDSSAKETLRSIVGEKSARYVMEADLAELLSNS